MRLRIGTAGVLVVLWMVGCGGSGGGGGSTAPAADSGTSDGGTSADAGTGADGGGGDGGLATDGGTGADGGGGDAGPATDGGTGADGGSSIDGGSGGGGGSDGGGGSGGGGVAAGCEGVVPADLGTSFSFSVQSSDRVDRGCDRATSDEAGNVAAVGPSSSVSYDWHWYLYNPKTQRFADIFGFEMFPQGEGFESVYSYDLQNLRVAAWTPDGKRTLGKTVAGDFVPSVFRAWPNGLFVVSPYCSYLTNEGSYTMRLFDPATNEKASATVSGCGPVLAAAVDANQSWLVVVPGSAVGQPSTDAVARWFDSTGKSLTGWFPVSALAPKQRYLMHALIGGGAVLQVDGIWTAFIPSGKAELQPAPEFLTSHPEADFTLVRGARAYAILPRSGDTTQLELYSASGNRCGAVKFPVGGLTTGADGSVIGSSGTQGCTKTVWPGLLR